MKRIVAIAILILATFSLGLGQTNTQKYSSNNKAEREILEIERKWADAYVHNDADFIANLIADDFLGDKTILKSWLQAIRARELTHEYVRHENLQVRIYGDFAVLRGFANIKGKNKEEDITGRYRFMDVFKKRNGRWQVIASQSVHVPSQ